MPTKIEIKKSIEDQIGTVSSFEVDIFSNISGLDAIELIKNLSIEFGFDLHNFDYDKLLPSDNPILEFKRLRKQMKVISINHIYLVAHRGVWFEP